MSKWNFKQELGRKFIHILSIAFIIIYLIVSSRFNEKIALFILTAILIIMIHLEFIRIEQRKKIPIISRLWKFKRAEEKSRLGSEVFFLIGSIICLALFDLRIAIAAILMTTFGDMAAAIIGKRFGKRKIKKDKTFIGSISELITNLIIGYIVLNTSLLNIPTINSIIFWPILLTMAISATTIETFVTKLDDNLLIQVISGFNGQLLLFIFSWLGMI